MKKDTAPKETSKHEQADIDTKKKQAGKKGNNTDTKNGVSTHPEKEVNEEG